MGNASSGTEGRLDGRTASLPKDGHVLRLWAEVFVASVDPGSPPSATDLKWTKVTEDIVPVNVTCSCKLPTTKFHVVAYNSQVEKVCDAYIEQPGQKIEHPSDSFVHWHSKDTDKHWGLNFTSKEDAARFEIVCTMTGSATVSKSTTFGTVRSRSKPSSRERDPKKSASSPGEIFNTTTFPEERSRGQAAQAMLTLPRFHQRSRRPDTRAVFVVGHDGAEGDTETPHLPESISVNVNPASARLGTVSAPVSPTGEMPSVAFLTVPGKNGTLCKDNLRSILYGSGIMPPPRDAAATSATSDARPCACLSTDFRESSHVCNCAADHEDDTATIVGDHSTLIFDAATPRARVDDIDAPSIAERGGSSSLYLPGSLSPTANECDLNSCEVLDSSIASRLLIPVLQSTPLVPGFGSEACAGDPGISLPTRTTPTLVATSGGSSSGARRSLAQWLPEHTTAAAVAEARLRARSCTDSGIGGTTCSESAESVRTSARSDACSSTGYGPMSSSSSVASSAGRRLGSTASSYSSDGSGRTATTKRSSGVMQIQAASVASSTAFTNASADASDGDDSDSGHSMTTVTATGSLLSLAHQTGATRKAGWLEVKNWLVRRGRRIQLASRRKWKRYWVSLKGSTLLFYQRSSGGGGGVGRLQASTRSPAARESKSRPAAPTPAASNSSSGGGGIKVSLQVAHAGDDRSVTDAAESEDDDGNGGVEHGEADDESLPRHLLDISDCLVQPVPEHPRRQHVFALSTHRGDAYLFQAQSRVDHDQWIATIHGACAAQYARQLGREDTQRMLVGEIDRLEEEIEQDSKMKNMAELQLSTTLDAKIGRAIVQQMAMWEKKQECRYMDQYRYRCYLAALQGDGCGAEQPNPKSLLAAMSQSSKSSLNRIGSLGVTTFHALICSRLSETYDAVLARCKRRRGGVSGVGGNGVGGSSFASAVGTPRSLVGLKARGRPATPSSADGAETADDVVGMVRSISGHGSLYREGRVTSLVESRAGNSFVHRATSLKAQTVPAFCRNLKRVDLPNGQAMAVELKCDTMADELLDYVCSKRQLTSSDCFLRVRLAGTEEFACPLRTDCIGSLDLDKIEICRKVVFQIELSRREGSCGLQLEAELGDGAETEDELHVFVCALTPCSTAAEAGLLIGDEILVINGKMVSDLDMVFIENLVASSSSLRMTVRSCRLEKPVGGRVTNQLMQHADIYISNMMCPPPPAQARLPDKFIDELIVPAPSWVQAEVSASDSSEELVIGSLAVPLHKQKQPAPAVPDHKIKELLQGAEQVTHLCRMANERVLDDTEPSGSGGRLISSGGSTVVDGAIAASLVSTTSSQPASHSAVAAAATLSPLSLAGLQPLSEAQRLRKVVVELVDTERAYVKDLNCLIERYLEPLKEETFLSSEEVIHLFGNIQEIVHFQRQFLSNLEEAAEVAEFGAATRTSELKGVLHSIAGSFLYYANHFRLYSSFCASHSRAQKVFTTEENAQLKEFLRARNPKQQHSATLESYLIKPIQRVLKYPLLLAQLRNLSQSGSDEQDHLNEALVSMEKVAEHINEMQKIYEEYGHEFDELMRLLNRQPSHHRGRQLQQQQLVGGGPGTPAALGCSIGVSSPSMSNGTGSGSGRTASLSDRHRKVEINVGDLDYYGEAEWLNATDTVSKPRKGWVHVTTIFVFKNGIVFLCQEKPKPKKKGKGSSAARTSIVDSANSSSCDVVERRFMPVDCLQVRTLPTEHAHVAMWELLLLKSAVEGRAAEKSYLLAHSDVKTRDAFIQNIRQVIRESVDRMTVKSGSRAGGKPRVASAADFAVRGSRAPAIEITTRYSMNFDLEKVHEDLGKPVPERSRTIGDLQSVDSACSADRTSLSQASVGSADSTGAKLIYSSQDPFRYSSRGSLESADSPGSPVWKQRSPGGGSNSSVAAQLDDQTALPFDFPGTVQVVGNGSAVQRSLLLPQVPLEGTTEC